VIELLPALVAGALLFPYWRRCRYGLFIVLLVVGEFYYLRVGAGTARVYHFVAVLLVAAHAKAIPRLLRSGLVRTWVFFALVNLGSIALSDAPERAAASFLTVLANLSIAAATAILLLSGKIPTAALRRILVASTLVAIGWGLLQIVAFRFGGVVLALSDSQIAQIESGFGPGFRTEANTFGKSMVTPFMLLLPEFIRTGRRPRVGWTYLAFITGILMNFTRSAIYGMGISSLFVVGRYLWSRRGGLLFRKGALLAAAAVLGVSLMMAGTLSASDYAVHKLNTFFSRDEILRGGSSSYRLEMATALIDDTFSSAKKILAGSGWGQTWLDIRGLEVQAGAGDFMSIWAFCGVFGAILYLVVIWQGVRTALRSARSGSHHPEYKSMAEGTAFALFSVFVVGQISGAIASPEFWMLMGVAIFFSVKEVEAGAASGRVDPSAAVQVVGRTSGAVSRSA
jgi:hypothetical protein